MTSLADSQAAAPQHDSPPTALLPVGTLVLTPEGPGTVFTAHIDGTNAAALVEGENGMRAWAIRDLTYPDHTPIPTAAPAAEQARTAARRAELDQAHSAEGLDIGDGYRLTDLDLNAGYGWITDATGARIAFIRTRPGDNGHRHWWLQLVGGGSPDHWTYPEKRTDREHAAVRAAREIRWHLDTTRNQEIAPLPAEQAQRTIKTTLARVRELRALALPVSPSTGRPVEAPEWHERYRRYLLTVEQMTALASAAEHALTTAPQATGEQRRRRRVLTAAAEQLHHQAYDTARQLATIPAPGQPDPYAEPYTAGARPDPIVDLDQLEAAPEPGRVRTPSSDRPSRKRPAILRALAAPIEQPRPDTTPAAPEKTTAAPAAVVLTAPERALLRKVYDLIGPCIANTEYGIESMALGHRSGCGAGFAYRCTKKRITGQWHQWIVTDRWPDGSVKNARKGRLLQEVSITYTRLAQWCDSLPEQVHAQALAWWRTYPENTRDLPALARLTLEQLADPEDAQLALW
ncbi:hypothetical protein [Nocardia brasiliensis]|uniref:hypothetical protein n=1 Tax=Nocardia brasiliensis TaxID=37326 RepID=UPI0024556FB0|nr:hypothetical protein [Nocardia brasiliensis]